MKIRLLPLATLSLCVLAVTLALGALRPPARAVPVLLREQSGFVERGHKLFQSKGCIACHVPGHPLETAPDLAGIFGKTVTLTDGTEVVVDEPYLRESISEPRAKLVKGYPANMPSVPLTDEDLAALVAYVESLTAPR